MTKKTLGDALVGHGAEVLTLRVLEYYERGTLRGALEKLVKDMADGRVKASSISHIYTEHTNHAGWLVLAVINTEK